MTALGLCIGRCHSAHLFACIGAPVARCSTHCIRRSFTKRHETASRQHMMISIVKEHLPKMHFRENITAAEWAHEPCHDKIFSKSLWRNFNCLKLRRKNFPLERAGALCEDENGIMWRMPTSPLHLLIIGQIYGSVLALHLAHFAFENVFVRNFAFFLFFFPFE